MNELEDHMVRNHCLVGLWELFVLKTERDDVRSLWVFHIIMVGDRTQAGSYNVEIVICSLNLGTAGKQSIKSVVSAVHISEGAKTGNCCTVPYATMRRITSENKWEKCGRMPLSRDFGVMVSVSRA